MATLASFKRMRTGRFNYTHASQARGKEISCTGDGWLLLTLSSFKRIGTVENRDLINEKRIKILENTNK